MRLTSSYWADFVANLVALRKSASTWFVNIVSAFIGWAAVDYAPLPEAGRAIMRQAVDSAITGVFQQHPLLTVAGCAAVFLALRAHPQGGLTK